MGMEKLRSIRRADIAKTLDDSRCATQSSHLEGGMHVVQQVHDTASDAVRNFNCQPRSLHACVDDDRVVIGPHVR